MRATALAARRSRAQLGLLATIVLLAALIVATVGATVGYVQSAATAGAREALAGAPPAARGVQVQTRLADDATAQDVRVREVVETDLAGVPLIVDRTVRTEPLPLAASSGSPGGDDTDPAGEGLAADRAVLEVDPALPDVAAVTGKWPSAPGETALHAAAAETLGLGPGDVVVVDRSDTDPQSEPGTELTVVGTWRPLDAEHPRWFDDPLAVSGVDGSVAGPFVVTPETLDGLGTTPLVRWTVVPDASRVVPADLAAAAAGASSLRDHLREDDAVAVRGLTVTGALAATAAEARAALAAAGAVTLVPVALLVVVSVVALVQVARLLAQTRATDVGLLVARGASTRQLVALSAAEAGAAVGAGALLGTGGALLALRASPDAGAAHAAPWLVAVLGAVVGSALVTGVAWLQARSVARRHEADRSGRARAAAAAGTLVLTVVVAALCLWQLLRYGSPVVPTGATTEVDPLAVLAPAAVLVALAVVGAAVLGPFTALAERVTARGLGLTVPLAARQVARRLVVVAVPVVLVVLAAGSGTLAGTYAGTTQSLRTTLAELRTGADVRVATGGPATVAGTGNPPVVAEYAALDGATGASSVLELPGVVGEDPLTLVALGADAAPDVLSLPPAAGDAGPAAGLRDAAADLGVPLPDDATGLTVGLTASVAVSVDVTADLPWYWADVHQRRSLRATAWVADAAGALSQVPLGAVEVSYAPDGADVADAVGAQPAARTLSGDLPGPGRWRLVAVDLLVGTPAMPAHASVVLDRVTATAPSGDDELALGDGWAPATSLVREELAVVEPAGAAGFAAELGGYGLPLPVRVLPGGDDALAPLPVTLPAPVAERYDLVPGDESVVTVSGTDLPVRVTRVVDVLPGAVDRAAVLADQGTLLQHLVRAGQSVPRPGEVWLGAADDADRAALATAAEALARERGAGDVVVAVAGADAGPDVSAPVRVAFWLAAAGALVLSLAGVLAVAAALLGARRAEVAVLRALGMPPGAQARGRALEIGAVTGASLVLGVLAGWAVATLTVPALARATLGAAAQVLPVPLDVAVVPTVLLLGVLATGLGAVAAVVAARVRAQALDGEYREEIR